MASEANAITEKALMKTALLKPNSVA